MRKSLYTALNVLSAAELEARFHSTLPTKFYHHSTCRYGWADFDEREGLKVSLHIVGRLTTDVVDCLVVENPFSQNEHPHITLATAEGVKPVRSNDELRLHYDKVTPLDEWVETVFTNNKVK